MIALAALAAGPAPPDSARPRHYVDFLQGNRVARLWLDDLRTTVLFEFPPGAAPAGADSIEGDGGSFAWLAAHEPAATLLTWANGRRSGVPLQRWPLGSEGYQVEYGANDVIVRVIPDRCETVLGDFLVSPDGRRVAWNVNLVAGMSPDSGGTTHRRHLVFVADIDGRNVTQVLDESFAVPSLFADADETRHLSMWSRVTPDRIYMTRLGIRQMGFEDAGLAILDLKSHQVDTTRMIPEQILALSRDETHVAHTPDDETCCAGFNYTNNRIVVRDLASGQETVVLDEWKEFGNEVEDSHPEKGTDYLPENTAFSPDGRRLAVTIREWPYETGRPGEAFTVIRGLAPVGRGGFHAGRAVVEWMDDSRVILGRSRAEDFGTGKLDSLYVYDVVRNRETPLPVKGIVPLGVGP